LFDPFKFQYITRFLQGALSYQQFLIIFIANGAELSRQFSWDKTTGKAMEALTGVVRRPVDRDDEGGIVNRLVAQLAALPRDQDPTELQLARIADCIERNTALARAHSAARMRE
jgi:hypothetical protein